MIAEDLIVKILNAKSPNDIFKGDAIKEFKTFAKMIHPDICKVSNSSTAFIKLKQLLELSKNGKTFNDDIGTITIKGGVVYIKGSYDYLKKSYDNYMTLMKINDPVFSKYLPAKAELKKDVLIFSSSKNVNLISDIRNPLEQDHVRWIFSRVIEFTSWLDKIGWCHAGINPSSICIVPETHGIMMISFYHMVPINSKLKTISAKFRNWYPTKSIQEKLATRDIDITMAKNLAIYMLGDKSGNGVRLRSKINPKFVDFLIKKDRISMDVFIEYRKIIAELYGKPKFIKFD